MSTGPISVFRSDSTRHISDPTRSAVIYKRKSQRDRWISLGLIVVVFFAISFHFISFHGEQASAVATSTMPDIATGPPTTRSHVMQVPTVPVYLADSASHCGHCREMAQARDATPIEREMRRSVPAV